MEGEQPSEELANVSGETVDFGAASENGSLTPQTQGEAEDNLAQSEKIDLGKFKDAQSLLDAYNNLQAQFTKKCQRLSQLEKETTVPSQTDKQQKLQEGLSAFLSTHDEAQEFAQQLTDKVAAGNDFSQNAFEGAYAQIVLRHIQNASQNDKIVDKYVLSCDSVRNQVIQTYLQSLQSNLPPLTISSSGQRVSDVLPDTPATLGDAKKMVERLFS